MGGCCDSKKKSTESSPGNPLKNRGCTDILCLVVFIGFLAGMVYIAVFSVMRGNAFRLVYGYDTYGNTCNMKNQKLHENLTYSGRDMTDRPYVFFADLMDPLGAMQLCVKQCPNKRITTQQELQDYSKASGSALCRYDIDVESYSTFNQYGFGTKGPCPKLPIPKSEPLLNRCVPDLEAFTNTTEKIIGYINADDVFRRVLSDLYQSWREIIALCFVALGVALLMVLLIRFLAAIIVWVIVIVAALGSIAGTVFLWWTYFTTKNDLDYKEVRRIPLLNVDISNEKAFLIMAIVATVLTVILLLVILVMRKRLLLVVALFKEAGKCLISMPLLLIQPVWTFIILMAFFTYWLIVLGYLSTSGNPEPDGREPGFVRYKEWDMVRYMWWYHLVGLIWVSEFILACQQMVVAGAVATWYFSRDKSQVVCPVGKSICRLILHHIGSVALGAFIITLVKLPRWILMYIQNKCKGSENAFARFCLKCCICCLWCLEKLLKFLNQNAYTIIAIEGTSFCPSAMKAFNIIINNVLRVAAINSVGDFVLFLGKIGVMAATAAVGVVWLKDHPQLHYYAIPVLVSSAFAFFIAHCALTVYEMVIDTMLLCFCEDCNMNDGTPGKEYYMSSSLMKYVKDTDKALEGKRRLENADNELETVEATRGTKI